MVVRNILIVETNNCELFQAEKETKQEPHMCLSDFIAPVESGVTDYIGVFAVTAGFGCSKIVEK